MIKNPRSFRLVCNSRQIKSVEALLNAEGYFFEDEPFSAFCRKLIEEPRPLGSSLAAFFGYIYIQDRSSMLPPLALAPQPGDAVLDMCASPGGKSGFLAQLTGPEGFVLANEPNPQRFITLIANIRQANLLNVGFSSYPGDKLPASSWPMILLDPSCSGWGTAKKHPSTLKIWTGAKTGKLIAIQRQLLKHAAKLLQPGGKLLYSTCTTNWEEDEAQTLYAEQELGLQRQKLNHFAGFTFDERLAGCLLVNEEKSQSQGFYLSLLTKPGASNSAAPVQIGKYPFIDSALLASPVFDPTLLSAGNTALFGDKVYFLQKLSTQMLPPQTIWQGALLGNMKNGFAPLPRLRHCWRPDGPTVIIDDISEVRALLNGQTRQYGNHSGLASLFWRDLPLGIVTLRNGRIIQKFR